jgi:hypothetical protein
MTTFHTAHEAMMFAFRFAADQYPRTPMSRLMQGGPLGNAAGLYGIDGAGQAGMILAALGRMNADQRAVLIVRYGDVRHECPCCGHPAPTPEWRASVDVLSHITELADLPRALRHAAVEKIICRRRHISVSHWASVYQASERTIRQRVAKAKRRLSMLENQAVSWMTDHLEGRSLIEPA